MYLLMFRSFESLDDIVYRRWDDGPDRPRFPTAARWRRARAGAGAARRTGRRSCDLEPGQRLLFGVFEPRSGLQSFLGGTGQNQLVVDQLQLGDGHRNIVLRQAEVAAGIDDGVGD